VPSSFLFFLFRTEWRKVSSGRKVVGFPFFFSEDGRGLQARILTSFLSL